MVQEIDLLQIGESKLFEYHCWEDEQSADAELWYRSHSRVKVLGVSNGSERGLYKTKNERLENGVPVTYLIEFEDGFKGTAFEDELVNSEIEFFRPKPPKQST